MVPEGKPLVQKKSANLMDADFKDWVQKQSYLIFVVNMKYS